MSYGKSSRPALLENQAEKRARGGGLKGPLMNDLPATVSQHPPQTLQPWQLGVHISRFDSILNITSFDYWLSVCILAKPLMNY